MIKLMIEMVVTIMIGNDVYDDSENNFNYGDDIMMMKMIILLVVIVAVMMIVWNMISREPSSGFRCS